EDITRRERGYEARGGCVGGLKWIRARGSLAEAVSGCRYSRRSEGSGTEGSVVRNGVCIQRMWYCNLHAEGSYLEGPKAVIYRGNQGEGNRRYRAPTAAVSSRAVTDTELRGARLRANEWRPVAVVERK